MAWQGGWKTLAKVPASQFSRTGTIPDAQHDNPSANPGDRRPNWVTEGGRYEYMPPELIEDVPLNDARGGGLVDGEPQSHDYGIGVGAGLPLMESMAQNAAGHATDLGSVAARKYTVPSDQDGTWSRRLDAMPRDGEYGSQGNIDLQKTSLPATSPNAADRESKRQVSLWDRVFMRLTYQTDHRPLTVPTAYTAQPQPPASQGGQVASSPYATAATARVRVVNAIAPQLRRAPGPWDESMTVEGSDQGSGYTPAYSFFSGGL